MRFYKLAVLLLAFSFATSVSSVFAQDDDDDDDSGMEEMDEEEWQRQMDELTTRKNDLTSQLNSLNTRCRCFKESQQRQRWRIRKSRKRSLRFSRCYKITSS